MGLPSQAERLRSVEISAKSNSGEQKRERVVGVGDPMCFARILAQP